MFKEFAFFCATTLTATCIAQAKPDSQVQANFDLVSQIDYGLICYDSDAVQIPAAGTISGYINQRDRAGAFILRTQAIPLDDDVSFGVQVLLKQNETLDNVLVSVTHPPHTDRAIKVESWFTNFVPNQANGGSFTFEYDYEQTPGPWTFEAEHDGTLLYSVTFNVMESTGMTSAADACDGEPLLG